MLGTAAAFGWCALLPPLAGWTTQWLDTMTIILDSISVTCMYMLLRLNYNTTYSLHSTALTSLLHGLPILA